MESRCEICESKEAYELGDGMRNQSHFLCLKHNSQWTDYFYKNSLVTKIQNSTNSWNEEISKWIKETKRKFIFNPSWRDSK